MRQADHDPVSIRTNRTNLLLPMAPLMVLGVALSPALVRLLYRPNFHPVGMLAAYLRIGRWLTQMVKVVLLLGPAWIVASGFGAVGVAELGLIAVRMVGCWRFKVVSVGWEIWA